MVCFLLSLRSADCAKSYSNDQPIQGFLHENSAIRGMDVKPGRPRKTTNFSFETAGPKPQNFSAIRPARGHCRAPDNPLFWRPGTGPNAREAFCPRRRKVLVMALIWRMLDCVSW